MPRTSTWRLGAIALAVAVTTAGCAASDPEPTPLSRAVGDVPPAVIHFAVVGDSISAWDSVDPVTGSWIGASEAPRLRFAGGWAVPGATTADMRAGVSEVPDADVLVVMAGTNDFLPDFPDYTPAGTTHTITRIVEATGIGHVVLSAIAPNDYRQGRTDELNLALAALARQEGWTWIDPWTSVRMPDGGYRVGATIDGVHPTDEVEEHVGRELRAAITDAAHRGDPDEPALSAAG